MQGLRSKLPPANSLVTFEAAARHLNFTRAAGELNVTQAAVSRQIRALERHLGVRLFLRGPRGLKLTGEGHGFQQAVTQGLEYIAFAAGHLQQAQVAGRLTVQANNAVAFYWLRPSIARFMRANPDVDLRLVASDRHMDFEADGIDVAVRYGGGEWPGVEAMLLFAEEIFPVCSPGYLARLGRPLAPAELPGEQLLHMEQHAPDWINWAMWLRAQGVEPPADLERGVTYNNFPVLLQAAIEGHGIALGTRYLLDDLINGGRLVRASEATLHSDRGYWLARPAGAPRRPEVESFCDWLLQETRGQRAEPIGA